MLDYAVLQTTEMKAIKLFLANCPVVVETPLTLVPVKLTPFMRRLAIFIPYVRMDGIILLRFEAIGYLSSQRKVKKYRFFKLFQKTPLTHFLQRVFSLN